MGVHTPILSVVPIADRTVWRLGKTGALQSYPARSFYLPVPEAKKIIEKRVLFVKTKLEGDATKAHAYFSTKGFTIGLKDLSMIADAIEGVLVQQDYVSGLIGRLGNFDIRRMLKIAERIFLSPEIHIDQVVKAHFSGRPLTSDSYRTYRALIKGEYDRFSDDENGYVTNLFLTDAQQPASPLLLVYLLSALKSKSDAAAGTDADERHWVVSELVDYLEIAGSPREATAAALQKLLGRGLIESLDPNTKKLGQQDLVAVKEAGLAHLELVFTAPPYLEQCALSTGLNDRAIRDKLKELMRGRNRDSFVAIRDVFVDYLLRTDATRLTIPGNPEFRLMNEARTRLKQTKS